MRWSNKYHKGFNRLWFAITGGSVVIALLYILLSDSYKAEKYIKYPSHIDAPHFDKEKKIAAWAQQEWRERYDPDSGYYSTIIHMQLTSEVESLPESAYFTARELRAMIELAILKEQSYPERASAARLKAITHFVIALVICVGVYGLGNALFFLGVWVARGSQYPKYGYSLWAIAVGILMFCANVNFGFYAPGNVGRLSYEEHWGVVWMSLTLIIGPLVYISGKRRGLGVAIYLLAVRKYLEIGMLIVMVLLPVLIVQFTDLTFRQLGTGGGGAAVFLLDAWIIIAFCLVVNDKRAKGTRL